MQNNERKLTNEEIEDIISVIPEIKSAVNEVSLVNRANIIDLFYKNIAVFSVTEKIIPEFISQLKIKIYNAFKRAQIVPGIPVGPRAAEAISVPMIQATLDSFKTTGAAVSKYGEETAREIISLSPRDPKIIRIFFNHPVSDVEILRDKRPYLEQIFVSDLIHPKDKFEIADPYEILGDQEPIWYQIHRSFNIENRDFALGSRMMRLHLNVNLMFEHKITSTKIVKIILGYQEDKILNKNAIICIPSPIMTKNVDRTVIRTTESGPKTETIKEEIAYAYIDIFSILVNFDKSLTEIYDRYDPQIRESLIKESWFETVLVPSFSNMQIRGVTGIKSVFIERSLVTQIINKEESEKIALSKLQLSNEILTNYFNVSNTDKEIIVWRVYYSHRRIKNMGIGPDKLAHLFHLCGILVLPYTDYELENDLDSIYMKCYVPERSEEYNKYVIGGLQSKIDNEKDSEKKKSLNDELIKEIKKRDNGIVEPLKWVSYKKQLEDDEDNQFTENKKKEILKYALGQIPDDFEFSVRRAKDSRTSISLAYEIVYALVEGTNLKEILKRSDVDAKRTYSNDFYEIYNLFGIEGLRNFILEELVGFSAASGYISRRHMLLLADFMTYRGIPTKITYTGLQNEFEDTLKAVGFERPGAVIAESAMTGTREQMLSVISATLLGNEANSGEAFKDMFISDKYVSKIKKEQELEEITVDQMEQQILSYQQVENNMIVNPNLPGVRPDIVVEIKKKDLLETEKMEIGSLGTGELQSLDTILEPPIGSAPIIQNIVKNTFEKMVPIKEIYQETEMAEIKIEPLRERAVISQLPVMKPEEQREMELQIRSVPTPVVETEEDIVPGLMDLLNQGEKIDLPIDIQNI